MEVPFFESICEQCGTHFKYPALSDFEYGQLIATTEEGYNFFKVDLLNNPVSEFIGTTKDKMTPKTFQTAVAGCADQALGSNVLVRAICPDCCSEKVKINTSKMQSKENIEVASYRQFLGLNDWEKHKLIESNVGKMI